MNVEKRRKESFAVIGKEGSTMEGEGFIQRLWNDANGHFGQVAHLAKRDGQGNLVGVWGCMTDFTRSFQPWEGFRNGLYLAGVECGGGAEPPEGWVKWIVPGFEYLVSECDGGDTFSDTLKEIKARGLSLAGAVQDFTDPQTGKNYMFFPIRKL